jgi:two-component system response regulator PfeR
VRDVLIIEDDPTLSSQISGLLEPHGFRVTRCFDGETGLAAALNHAFDLILLDVLLPKLDGHAVLRRVRQSLSTPVIMLTACGTEDDRIAGFQNGADDYVPKPCNFTELLLRVEAVLRRSQTQQDLRDSLDRRVIAMDDLVLNRSDLSVMYKTSPLELTPIQFKILWLLVQNRHEVLSKPYLYQAALERAFSRYDRSLDMHVSRIRKKLVEAGMAADRLSTQHGKGYSLS